MLTVKDNLHSSSSILEGMWPAKLLNILDYHMNTFLIVDCGMPECTWHGKIYVATQAVQSCSMCTFPTRIANMHFRLLTLMLKVYDQNT